MAYFKTLDLTKLCSNLGLVIWGDKKSKLSFETLLLLFGY